MLLTIVIPTYNRGTYLSRLLTQLEQEIKGLEGLVSVIICDNHSDDITPQLVAGFLKQHPLWEYYRHTYNVGSDRNFLFSVTACKTKYFWLFGDDDLPRTGLLAAALSHLVAAQPSLLYLPSVWKKTISSNDLIQASSYKPVQIEGSTLAHSVHVYTTFITSWIINKDELSRLGITQQELSTNVGSSFVQLGWILPLIKDTNNISQMEADYCICALSDNSGNYKMITTFMVNYPKLIIKLTHDNKKLRKLLLAPFLRFYLPPIIDSHRKGNFKLMLPEKYPLLESFPYLYPYKEYWRYALPSLLDLRSRLTSLIRLFVHVPCSITGRILRRGLKSISDCR